MLKYIVHKSDSYYPSAEEFEILADAVKAFRELRQERIDSLEYGGDALFETDYLCIVIDNIDAMQLAKELDALRLAKKEPGEPEDGEDGGADL